VVVSGSIRAITGPTNVPARGANPGASVASPDVGADLSIYEGHLHPDREIAAIARRQHGAVAAPQLLGLGLTRAQVNARVVRGLLHPAYDGVYFVGYLPSHPLSRYMAAVLATGGVLSHRTAAALHGLWDHHRHPEITTRTNTRSQPGLRRHRTRTLNQRDITRLHGIPCTTLHRTLVDLADVLGPDPFEAILRRAEAQGRIDRLDLHPIRGRRGATKIRRAHELTRSGAERAFRRAVTRARLPRPEYNALWNGFELDVLWESHRLAVEIDGYQHHRTREAFRQDRRKGNALAAAGITLLRFTYDDVVDRPAQTIATVTSLL
jgi:very-short-patch-repair endonuclease